jgi:hypothetical protein
MKFFRYTDSMIGASMHDSCTFAACFVLLNLLGMRMPAFSFARWRTQNVKNKLAYTKCQEQTPNPLITL